MRKILFTLTLFVSVSLFAGNQFEAQFEKANELYESANYEEALKVYYELEKAGINGFNLQFNIGNTHYKLDEIPSAILHYEKALKIDPSNEDVKQNLKLAYAKTTDKIEPARELVINRWWKEIINLNSADSWGIIATFLLFTSLMLALFYLLANKSIIRRIGFFGASAVLLIAIICYFFGYQQHYYSNEAKAAIIFTPTVSIKSAPGESGTVLFVLHKGTKVHLLESTNEWRNVALPNGNKGWIKENDIREI